MMKRSRKMIPLNAYHRPVVGVLEEQSVYLIARYLHRAIQGQYVLMECQGERLQSTASTSRCGYSGDIPPDPWQAQHQMVTRGQPVHRSRGLAGGDIIAQSVVVAGLTGLTRAAFEQVFCCCSCNASVRWGVAQGPSMRCQ